MVTVWIWNFFAGFRCVFCHQFNPPREIRPTAPKLPVNQVLIEEMEQSTSTVKSDTSEASDDGGGDENKPGSEAPKVKTGSTESETEEGPYVTLAESSRNSDSKHDDADVTAGSDLISQEQPSEFSSPMSIISLSEASSKNREEGGQEGPNETEEINNTPLESNLSDKPSSDTEECSELAPEPESQKTE